MSVFAAVSAHRSMTAFIIDSLGAGEILVLLFLAMIVVGPERFPDTARQIGTAVAKVRKSLRELTGGVQEVIDDPALAPLKELGEFAVRPKQKITEIIRDAERSLELAESDAAIAEKPVSPGGPGTISIGEKPTRAATTGEEPVSGTDVVPETTVEATEFSAEQITDQPESDNVGFDAERVPERPEVDEAVGGSEPATRTEPDVESDLESTDEVRATSDEEE